MPRQSGGPPNWLTLGFFADSSSAFSAALACCSRFAAALTSLRRVAASSSRSASRSFRVQYSRSSIHEIVHGSAREPKTAEGQPLRKSAWWTGGAKGVP
jgi:hypothetical protein